MSSNVYLDERVGNMTNYNDYSYSNKEENNNYSYVFRNLEVHGNAYINSKNLHKVIEDVEKIYYYELISKGDSGVVIVARGKRCS